MDVKLRVEGGREAVLKILGMHCATCALTVQRALASVPGVVARISQEICVPRRRPRAGLF